MFQIAGLSLGEFSPYFAMPDEELLNHRARRMVATSNPGFPCRVSLKDAEVGEALILIHYMHQDTQSPYRSSHAIFVREQATEYIPASGHIPQVLRKRILSVRAFTSDGTMQDACVTEGTDLAAVITTFFNVQEVSYVDIHNAAPGCFAARAVRI